MIFYYYLFLNLLQVISIRIVQHPLEKRAAYIYGINSISSLDKNLINELQSIFNKCPLLIFKNVGSPSPNEFINFVKNFDEDCDLESLYNPDINPHQMLQPFDQFPECKHVAPRGNAEINNFYNIKNINIKPSDTFINNYLWHTDLLGHEYKLPNVVTGFYIIEQPLIGGDTDFISGETIYENLDQIIKEASENILIEINRNKFITKYKEIDYSGSLRLEKYEEISVGKTYLPLVFPPEKINEKPRILILPSFFEKVVGLSVGESREWIKNFMYNHVLPHRISIQWKKGDLGVFNNRRFIHSSTPARNYLDFTDNSKRLLLQTFIPTNRPLCGIKPLHSSVDAIYKANWVKDINKSIIVSNENIKFAMISNSFNNSTSIDTNKYILVQKPKNCSIQELKLNPYKYL